MDGLTPKTKSDMRTLREYGPNWVMDEPASYRQEHLKSAYERSTIWRPSRCRRHGKIIRKADQPT